MNLSARQLVCFGAAVVVGVPTYLFTRGTIGNSGAVLLMMGIMMPLFLLAMFERDGQPAEKILRNYIRTKLYWPVIRPFKTENLYEILEKEGVTFAKHQTATTAAKATVTKRKTGKGKQGQGKRISEK
jgi:hypothetical protein